MANPIAEAFVRLRPDASALRADTQAAIAQALGRVSIPVGVGQNLGQMAFGGPGFQQAVSKSTSTAVGNTVIPPTTQAQLAQRLFGPGFRNETGRALQGALSGLGQGQLAAQFAFFGPGGAALAVLGAGFVTATINAAQLEKQLDVLAEVTGASEDEIARMADEAERLGASLDLPAVTATDAANAMLELAKAGLSTRDVIGGVEGVLQLATAANIDAGAAARIAASALNAFSLAGTEAVTVANLLAGASIAAQGDIGDMALALQQSAAVADQAGLSVQQLVTFITLLAKQGILGSDAGTSIRTSLLRLVPTTKEAAGFMEALGVQLDRTKTLGQQLPDLIDQYQIALSGLNPTLRQSVLQQIFGTDAIRAASVAIEGGSKAFRVAQFEVSRYNTAQALAAAQTQGLSGGFQGLVSGAQTFGTNLGQLTNPILTDFVAGLSEVVRLANRATSALEDLSEVELPGGRLGEFFATATKGAIGATLPIAGIAFALDKLNEKDKDAASGLLEMLENAENLRIELAKIGLPTDAVTADIKRLKAELKDLTEGEDVTLDLATPLERALAVALKFRESLIEAGKPVEGINRQIDLLRDNLRVGIILGAQEAEREIKARSQLARALGLSSEQLSKLMQTVKQDGTKAGVELGKSMIDGLTGIITAEEGRAIAAAQATLESVRREGEKQVIESIRSARSNLESLGSSLSGSLGDIIDVGPIGQAIDEIDKKLEEFQEKVSRRQLRFDFRQGQLDLREAQEAIAQVGELTPEQKKSQAEFLAPFREKVLDAKAAVKEFDLEKTRTELELTRDKAVTTAEQGIQVLIDKFQNGRVSVGEFERLLSNQLNPALDILNSKAGTNLGLQIKRDFMRDVETLRKQAEALAGFLGRSGTTPGTQVIKPSDTVAEVNRNIAGALAALAQTQKEALTVSKEERDKADIQNGLLKRLIRLVEGSPKKATSGTSSKGGGNTGSGGGGGGGVG